MNTMIPQTGLDLSVEEFMQELIPSLKREFFQNAMSSLLRQHGLTLFEIDQARYPLVKIRVVLTANLALGRGKHLRRKIASFFCETGYGVPRQKLHFRMDPQNHLSIYAVPNWNGAIAAGSPREEALCEN